MISLKKNLKRKNVESNKFEAIVTGFSREDAVRIALYYVENIASTEKHIEIIKMWLKNKNSITKKELEIAKFELKFEYPIYNLTFCNTNLIKYYLRTVLESSVGMNLRPFEYTLGFSDR